MARHNQEHSPAHNHIRRHTLHHNHKARPRSPSRSRRQDRHQGPSRPSPHDIHRRRAVLVADMDSTIVTGETLDELADL
ncbi:hypothetical protein, partial [Gluconobacter albidus]|uniref:hypothetical protein n=1 Tax=Gluconobacter albidus TaxID=318683 RepID=UPI001B8B20CD